MPPNMNNAVLTKFMVPLIPFRFGDAMLSIFTVPKPFKGHIDVIQRNALQSWKTLHPDLEIFLCSNLEETGPLANEYGTHWIQGIECTSLGTPLLSSVFQKVAHQARHRLLCYVNADIILLPEFLEAIRSINLKKFLMVGQRTDVDIDFPLSSLEPNWLQGLRKYIQKSGVPHPPAGSDYFVFPKKEGIENLPAFAVGRRGWDNFMIYHAWCLKVPVVDASSFISVIHQNHDYSHIPQGNGTSYDGIESDYNLGLLGSRRNVYTLNEAHFKLIYDPQQGAKLVKKTQTTYWHLGRIVNPYREILRNFFWGLKKQVFSTSLKNIT